MNNLNTYLLDSKPLIKERLSPIVHKKNQLLFEHNDIFILDYIEKEFFNSCKRSIINFVAENKPELSYEDILVEIDSALIYSLIQEELYDAKF